jgi:hypothetical protein
MPERQKKIVKANYHFQRVLNGTPSPYFKSRDQSSFHSNL